MFRFKVDPKAIKTREYLDTVNDLEATNKLMARFLVDDNDEPIPQDKALEMLLDLDIEANQDAQYDFLAALTPRLRNVRR